MVGRSDSLGIGKAKTGSHSMWLYPKLSRAAAEVYMRRWDLITDGSIMRLDYQLRAGAVTNGVALQVTT